MITTSHARGVSDEPLPDIHGQTFDRLNEVTCFGDKLKGKKLLIGFKGGLATVITQTGDKYSYPNMFSASEFTQHNSVAQKYVGVLLLATGIDPSEVCQLVRR